MAAITSQFKHQHVQIAQCANAMNNFMKHHHHKEQQMSMNGCLFAVQNTRRLTYICNILSMLLLQLAESVSISRLHCPELTSDRFKPAVVKLLSIIWILYISCLELRGEKSCGYHCVSCFKLEVSRINIL